MSTARLAALTGAGALCWALVAALPFPRARAAVDAARRMEAAMAALRQERSGRGLSADPRVDRNLTGLIGLPASGLTTTLGSLAAKRTSAAPDMAALMVRLPRAAGVEAGDRVAVNASSSFPALILATVCAAEALGAEVALLPSTGSASYGDNDPRFAWIDMEDARLARGLITTAPRTCSRAGATTRDATSTPPTWMRWPPAPPRRAGSWSRPRTRTRCRPWAAAGSTPQAGRSGSPPPPGCCWPPWCWRRRALLGVEDRVERS